MGRACVGAPVNSPSYSPAFATPVQAPGVCMKKLPDDSSCQMPGHLHLYQSFQLRPRHGIAEVSCPAPSGFLTHRVCAQSKHHGCGFTPRRVEWFAGQS